ncbi:hypothetical protein IU427_08550 [Nocardia beijingensis]|uniref:hypothetical protein n=1 Tax=Nocardia beijingensis TaxID=95162 RepID=UPI001895E08A|nr:hypothetical protein [Nocardia beijingensis]MBF6465234.1 hypothetical protein [Nocardia beijingensis]
MAHNTETVPLPAFAGKGAVFSSPQRPGRRDIIVTWAFSQMHHGSQFGQRYACRDPQIELYGRKIM